MSWYDFILNNLPFQPSPSYGKPEGGDVEGAIAALDPHEYGTGWGVTYGAPWVSVFNPSEVGLAPLDKNKADAALEMSTQQGEPVVKSSLFGLLYLGNMKTCYADQHHRWGNPNASQACQDLADRGDYSGLMLDARQRDLMGITPPGEQASDLVLQWESDPEGIIGVSPDKEPKPSANLWSEFIKGYKAGYNLESKGVAPGQVGEAGDKNVFQESIEKWTGMIGNVAKVPNYATALVIGGAALLLLLVLRK